MVILACIAVIPVCDLRQVTHSFLGLLEDQKAYGYIVGCAEILAILVF